MNNPRTYQGALMNPFHILKGPCADERTAGCWQSDRSCRVDDRRALAKGLQSPLIVQVEAHAMRT